MWVHSGQQPSSGSPDQEEGPRPQRCHRQSAAYRSNQWHAGAAASVCCGQESLCRRAGGLACGSIALGKLRYSVKIELRRLGWSGAGQPSFVSDGLAAPSQSGLKPVQVEQDAFYLTSAVLDDL